MNAMLVIGGGQAGARAVRTLRSEGYAGRVTLVCEEAHVPYERPPLSKEYLAQEKPFERLYLRPREYWADKQVELLLGREVTAVDPAARQLTCADGSSLTYGELIWATGGDPRQLSCPGSDLAGIRTTARREGDGERERCVAAGMDDYLSKPVMVKDLKVMLQRWSFVVKGEKSNPQNPTRIDPASDPVDWTQLQEISMADPAFQLELVKGFVKDGKRFLADAKRALAAKDWVTLANKAHQIKGASASVAVRSMSDIAAALHERVKANNLQGVPKLIAQLEQILKRIEVSVERKKLAIESKAD